MLKALTGTCIEWLKAQFCMDMLSNKLIQATLINPDMCNTVFVQTGQIGRSQSLPVHITPICIIRILPNLDRNLRSASVRIKHSSLYLLIKKVFCGLNIQVGLELECRLIWVLQAVVHIMDNTKVLCITIHTYP